MNPTFKKFAILGLKIALSAGLLGYLFYSASQKEGFWNLVYGQKNWWNLLLTLAIVLIAVVITALRWRLLARTLGMELSARDALRVSFVGYAVNLMPLGMVGGDAIKAVFLAHHNPTQKTAAVASVVVDRVLGLIALLFLAGIGSCFIQVDKLSITSPEARAGILALCRAVQISAVVGGIALALLFTPGFTTSRVWNWLAKLPLVGGVIRKLVDAMHVYRGRADNIAAAVGMSLVIHTLYATMIYFAGGALLSAAGQPTPQPLLADHFAFVPIAMASGTLPIGAFEITMNMLYAAFLPLGVHDVGDKGFLIALVYRICQILVAGGGVLYYLFARGDAAVASKEELEEIEEDELLTRGAEVPVG